MTGNYKKLRELAEKATPYVGVCTIWKVRIPLLRASCDFADATDVDLEYIAKANPAAIIALIDRLEAAEKAVADNKALTEKVVKGLTAVDKEATQHPRVRELVRKIADTLAPTCAVVPHDCDGALHAGQPNPDWPESDERMDIIGQNGGDGEHYENIPPL